MRRWILSLCYSKFKLKKFENLQAIATNTIKKEGKDTLSNVKSSSRWTKSQQCNFKCLEWAFVSWCRAAEKKELKLYSKHGPIRHSIKGENNIENTFADCIVILSKFKKSQTKTSNETLFCLRMYWGTWGATIINLSLFIIIEDGEWVISNKDALFFLQILKTAY